MALTTTEFGKVFQRDLTKQDDIDLSASLNVRNGPATLYSIHLSNSSAGNAYASFKLYDHNGDGLVVGTTDPVLVIPVAGGVELSVDIAEGLALAAGLSFAGAQEDGDVATTAPAGDALLGWMVSGT